MINKKTIKKLKPRIKRVEGQIRGIMNMIEGKKYCVDILYQISAVEGALKSISSIILENHINTCVKDAMSMKNSDEIKEKISELMGIYEKFLQ